MIIPNIANILWKIKHVWNHQPVLIVTYCNQERMTNIWCVSCQMVHVISLHADTQAFTYAHGLTIMTGYNKKCKYYKKVPVPLDGITISWPRYNHPPSPQRTKTYTIYAHETHQTCLAWCLKMEVHVPKPCCRSSQLDNALMFNRKPVQHKTCLGRNTLLEYCYIMSAPTRELRATTSFCLMLIFVSIRLIKQRSLNLESTCVKNHEARNHNNSTFLHCMPGLAQNCSPPVPRNLPLRIQ